MISYILKHYGVYGVELLVCTNENGVIENQTMNFFTLDVTISRSGLSVGMNDNGKNKNHGSFSAIQIKN